MSKNASQRINIRIRNVLISADPVVSESFRWEIVPRQIDLIRAPQPMRAGLEQAVGAVSARTM